MSTTTAPALTAELDWPQLGHRLDEQGFAITPPLLTSEQCAAVAAMFDDDERFRSTVVMARHAFGEGRYRYFADPLPELVQALRTQLYPPLARIANSWADRLGERRFPATLDDLLVSVPGSARPGRPRCCCATARPDTTACTRTSTAT
jgi:hypothetical protein